MTDEASFLLVFALLYLWQCCHWFRPGTITISSQGNHRITIGATDPGFESRLGSPILLRPWPPFPVNLALSPWPFSASESAIVAFQERSWTPYRRSRQVPICIRLQDIDGVEAQGRKILVNGRFFVEAADEGTALSHVDFIGDLINLPQNERAAYIEASLRAALSITAAQEAWAEMAKSTRPLIRKCQVLFMIALVIMPITFLSLGAAGTWFIVLPLLLVANLVTSISFLRAHRRLFPDLQSVGFTTFMLMLFFPPETLRAHDYLSRFALAELHAWPVVQMLATEPRARDFLGHLLRDLQHPIPAIEDLNEAAETCSRFMRDLEWRLLTQGMQPDEINELIAASPTDARRCPRCLAESEAESCDQCRISTIAMASS